MKAHASSAGEAARSGAFTCTRFTLPLSFSELQVCWSPTIQPFRHQGPAISVLSNSVQEPSLALAKKAPTKRRQISIRVFLCLYHPPSILLSAHTFQTGFENLVRTSILPSRHRLQTSNIIFSTKTNRKHGVRPAQSTRRGLAIARNTTHHIKGASSDKSCSKEKSHINVVVIGHVDSGKSTTTGRKYTRTSSRGRAK